LVFLLSLHAYTIYPCTSFICFYLQPCFFKVLISKDLIDQVVFLEFVMLQLILFLHVFSIGLVAQPFSVIFIYYQMAFSNTLFGGLSFWLLFFPMMLYALSTLQLFPKLGSLRSVKFYPNYRRPLYPAIQVRCINPPFTLSSNF